MSREMYKRVAPHIDRVRYDGGVPTDNMSDLFLLQRSNEQYKDYLKLSFCPELHGYKKDTRSGIDYVTKGYSLLSNDLTQTSSANQPYLDKIAPAEKLSAKNPNNGSNYLTHPTISFGASDEWTVETTLRFNGDSTTTNLCGQRSGVGFGYSNIALWAGNNKFVIVNDSNVSAGGIAENLLKFIGKTVTYHFVSKGNGSLIVYANGNYLETITISTNLSFSNVFTSRGDYFRNGVVYSHHIFSKALSASEVAERSAILRSIFPEIPFTRIGDQIWGVRNFEAAVTPQGNLIPEVQSNTTWATSQTLYNNAFDAASGTVEQKTYAGVKAAAMWCHYGNDPALGAVYGKLYNWFAVKLLQMDIDYYNANNPTTPWGWRVPTQADFQTLSAYLGGDAVSGGKLKIVGTQYWRSPNLGANNVSGFSAIGAGRREEDGSFNSWFFTGITRFRCIEICYGFEYQIENIVVSGIEKAFGYSLRLIKS